MTFEAHWYLDASPSDEWPMALEADETGVNGIWMPVEHENGYVSNVRFVLESKLMDENERLRKENDRLRELVYVVYAYYASGTISPCDICDSTGCQYVGEAESGCRYHNRDDAAAAADEEILRRMSELGVDTKELI